MALRKLDQSGGSVFRDTGLSPTEAATLKIRSDLMIKLAAILEQRKLTQAGQ